MKIALIPNKSKDNGLAVSGAVVDFLLSRNVTVYVEKKYGAEDIKGAVSVDKFPSELDFIIVIGGDGSVIDASVPATELDVPVLGVNLGNLGYLAEIEPSEIEKLRGLFEGKYTIEERMLLSCSVKCGDTYVESKRFAVNEVIVSHESYVGLANLKLTESNGAGVKYRADGLILSTPIGSTAYSFSAGGPILSHDIDSIVATPICPHSFFNRSIIFKPDEELSITNNGADALNVTVDGRFFTKLMPGGVCKVKASVKRFKMVSFNENNMFQALFGKMRKFEYI